jgi:hypothetical protein
LWEEQDEIPNRPSMGRARRRRCRVDSSLQTSFVVDDTAVTTG